MQTNSNNIVIKLLISPHMRILRHLILFAFIFSISSGIVWHTEEQAQTMTSFEMYSSLFFISLLFLGGCYLNIYVLTPRLLLKNRGSIYICSLLGVVVVILTIFISLQMLGMEKNSDSLDIGGISAFFFFKVIINLLSFTLSIFLLFTGTSTLVLFKYWIQDKQQSEELESTTLQLELKLLENQINPHFLFNMLNNANIMIKKDTDVAMHIVGKLEEMLRYQLNESTGKKVYLKDEIVFLNDFLELEKTRRDYFNCTVSEAGELEDVQIPPLLFITFVENAVKHNQDSRTTSYVHILFKVIEDRLIFVCENSIPQHLSDKKEVGGIGLANIKRRLNLLFKDNYSLEQTKTDTSYTVKLELKL